MSTLAFTVVVVCFMSSQAMQPSPPCTFPGPTAPSSEYPLLVTLNTAHIQIASWRRKNWSRYKCSHAYPVTTQHQTMTTMTRIQEAVLAHDVRDAKNNSNFWRQPQQDHTSTYVSNKIILHTINKVRITVCNLSYKLPEFLFIEDGLLWWIRCMYACAFTCMFTATSVRNCTWM